MRFLKFIFIFAILLSFAYSSEQNPTKEEVAKLYVATFNRAPDSAGLEYWVNNSGLTLSQIAQSFFDQRETQELYPPTVTNREFIESVYQNLFNREPDSAGWDYWEEQLNIGAFSKNRFIEAVINGALGDDAVILSNKTEVGLCFADAGLSDVEKSKLVMEGITFEPISVDFVKKEIEQGELPNDLWSRVWYKVYLHKNITSTVFWVGEESSVENGYIPNISSAWDSMWMENFGGVDSPDDRDGYYPSKFIPKENPFYFALPFNDFDVNGEKKAELASYIPWNINDLNESILKNRWIKIIKGDKVAYAQWEDVGPFNENDKEYVFGNSQPSNEINNHAGLDLSPAVRDYLGLSDIDTVDWRFVDESEVEDGPWKEVISTSGVNWIDWYKPLKYTSWQWQLNGDLDTSYDVDMYDVDLFDTDKNSIDSLHENGKKVICYFSAGSYEEWRDDASLFLDTVLGNELDGWAGERWLDIRDDSIKPIMIARLDLAKQKGCDGVEPDNIDGYTNNTGFDLNSDDQLVYNKFLVKEAHKRGLGIGLKNDLQQIDELKLFFDFAINEQCHFYNECTYLDSFLDINKAVFNVEYDQKYVLNSDNARDDMCQQSNEMGLNTLVLPVALDDSFRYSCVVDNIKSNWIINAFKALESDDFPRIKAISWWNEKWDEDGFDIDIRIESSSASLYRYKQMVQSEKFVTTPVIENFKLLPPIEGIYHSAFPDFGGDEENITSQKITQFETLADKKIVWAYFSNNWMDGIKFPLQDVMTIYNSGKIPFIRMMPRTSFAEYQEEEVYSMQKFINGEFDEELKAWAIAARDTHIPLLVEFGTEVNGMWFPWNGYYSGADTLDGYGDPTFPDGPERFRDAYRHIIDICKQNGADNITWFFHINTYSEPFAEWNSAKNYYPGDEYIDWLGVSVYGLLTKDGEYQEFRDMLNDVYPELVEISSNKPIAILEFGIREIAE